MIKVDKHPLTCACEACADLFPIKRFEPTWAAAEPAGGDARKVRGRVPIGDPRARMEFILWVTLEGRLASDWPGFPGTAGAHVELAGGEDAAPPRIRSTRDPALGALTSFVPLRRRVSERINARCLVEYGLASPDTADFIACEIHGHGLPALACRHVAGSPSPIDAVIIYDVDGDYPDLLCPGCLERYAGGDVDVALTVCSRCQQRHLYRHHLVGRTWYGAPAPK